MSKIPNHVMRHKTKGGTLKALMPLDTKRYPSVKVEGIPEYMMDKYKDMRESVDPKKQELLHKRASLMGVGEEFVDKYWPVYEKTRKRYSKHYTAAWSHARAKDIVKMLVKDEIAANT